MTNRFVSKDIIAADTGHIHITLVETLMLGQTLNLFFKATEIWKQRVKRKARFF